MVSLRGAPVRVLPLEPRLLLATIAGAEDGQLGRLDPESVDWSRLYALMVRERAASVAWARLPAEVRLSAPDRLARQFERLAAVSQFRQYQLTKRLEEALELCPAGAGQVVLLKGAALSRTCYQDPADRPMLDLDVLVEEVAAWEWHRRLRDAGWEWDEESFPRAAYRRHHHLPPLEDGRGTGALLEIHTGLFISGHPFALDASELRKRSVESEVGDQRALVPEPACHLVYISLHFAWSHALTTGGWRTFRDVGALTGSDDLRWPDVVGLARASRGASCCYWTLRLAARLGGVHIPEGVLGKLSPPLPEFVLAALERHFALQLFPGTDFCPSVRLSRLLWRLAMRSNGTASAIGPWAHTEDFPAGSEDPEGGVRKIIGHLQDVSGWSRYVRKVFDLSIGASAPAGDRPAG